MSWTWHVSLTVPPSTHIYKWILGEFQTGANPATDWHPIFKSGVRWGAGGGVEREKKDAV